MRLCKVPASRWVEITSRRALTVVFASSLQARREWIIDSSKSLPTWPRTRLLLRDGKIAGPDTLCKARAKTSRPHSVRLASLSNRRRPIGRHRAPAGLLRCAEVFWEPGWLQEAHWGISGTDRVPRGQFRPRTRCPVRTEAVCGYPRACRRRDQRSGARRSC